jgi:hypothetical protein
LACGLWPYPAHINNIPVWIARPSCCPCGGIDGGAILSGCARRIGDFVSFRLRVFRLCIAHRALIQINDAGAIDPFKGLQAVARTLANLAFQDVARACIALQSVPLGIGRALTALRHLPLRFPLRLALRCCFLAHGNIASSPISAVFM